METITAHCQYHPEGNRNCYACNDEAFHAAIGDATRAEQADARITWFVSDSQRSYRSDWPPMPGAIPTHLDGQRLHSIAAVARLTGIPRGLVEQWAERDNLGLVLDRNTTGERRYLTDADIELLSS